MSDRDINAPQWFATSGENGACLPNPDGQMQIDFAGDALYLTDRKTGKPQKFVVLVCVMPYSNLPFMMAMPKATTEWFFHGLNKALEFMGALPKEAKSDNMKQWVAKSDRYNGTIGATFSLLAIVVLLKNKIQ